MVMMRAANSRTSQGPSIQTDSTIVTSTAAVVSETTRAKFTTFMWGLGSAAMARSDRFARYFSASSAMSARDRTTRAESVAAKRPPRATSRNAATRKRAVIMYGDGARWRRSP
jgi:hypothetical protein